MVERFDPPRDLDWKPLPMRPDIAGQYVRYSDLAAARAEIERLTKERDEARAQVAAAYEVVAIRSENYACGAPYNQRATINALANHLRGMTPDDAQAALEAYGREKVRERIEVLEEAIHDADQTLMLFGDTGWRKRHRATLTSGRRGDEKSQT